MWLECNGIVRSDLATIDGHAITGLFGLCRALDISKINKTKSFRSLCLSIDDHCHLFDLSILTEDVLDSVLARVLTEAKDTQHRCWRRVITWTW